MKSVPQPPKLLLRFFRWFCHPHLLKYVEGDLLELFDDNVKKRGVGTAKWLFMWDVVKLLRPSLIRSFRGTYGVNHYGSIKQSLKISIRSFQRNKVYSLLNIGGLAIGISSCVLIMLWVQHELSYDSFHDRADRIYRISCNSEDFHTSVSPPALAKAMPSSFSSIQSTLRLRAYLSSGLYEVESKRFKEEKVLTADSNFFNFFSYSIIQGSRDKALDSPDKVAISKSTANKYFGKTDVIGESIRKDDEDEFIISAVFDDIPRNSHLSFDIVQPMSFRQAKASFDYNSNWSEFAFRTYVLIDQQFNFSTDEVHRMKEGLKSLYLSHEPGFEVHFNIEPIESIHLHSDLQFDTDVGGNILYVHTLISVAIFLLLIACINYMNLSTAQSVQRSKEVGLRKVIGASRTQIIRHFFIESLFYAGVSSFLAVGIIYLVLPFFNSMLDMSLILDLTESKTVLFFVAVTLFVGFLSGSYPAMSLSKSSPGQNFQKSLKTSKSRFNLRNALVIVQFVISIFLVAANFIVSDQLSLLQNKSLGFDKNNLLYTKINGRLADRREAVKNGLNANLVTSKYTFTSDIPINTAQANHGLDWEGKDPEFQAVIANMGVDENFLEVFKVQLAAGETFRGEEKSDKRIYMINESAAKIMGFTTENAVGKWLDLHGKGRIIGVIKDFHFKSLHMAIEPLVLIYYPTGNYVVFRSNQGELEQTLESIESVMSDIDPAHQFEYGFLDEDLDRLYKSEKQISMIFRLFALLSICISCLGIFGLMTFMIVNLSKEIGIRKVLGATRLGLARLLSQDFVLLLGISLLLSSPVTFFILDDWLQEFAYRITISIEHFLYALVFSVVLIASTISFQLYNACNMNPVDLLRDE
ncbi:MAG: ABC transporter permease [Cyclobacteriaceae bacterium]